MERMKNVFSRYSGLLVLVLIIGGIWFFSSQKNLSGDERTAIPKPLFNNVSETLGASVINCEFKVVSDFTLKDEKGKEKLIKYGTRSQDAPVNMVFSGLNTTTPVIKGNNGEDPLLVIANTDSEMTLASSSSFGDVFFYKIYKNQKVATWYKSYDMFGSPFALLSMGYCY